MTQTRPVLTDFVPLADEIQRSPQPRRAFQGLSVRDQRGVANVLVARRRFSKAVAVLTSVIVALTVGFIATLGVEVRMWTQAMLGIGLALMLGAAATQWYIRSRLVARLPIAHSPT